MDNQLICGCKGELFFVGEENPKETMPFRPFPIIICSNCKKRYVLVESDYNEVKGNGCIYVWKEETEKRNRLF